MEICLKRQVHSKTLFGNVECIFKHDRLCEVKSCNAPYENNVSTEIELLISLNSSSSDKYDVF